VGERGDRKDIDTGGVVLAGRSTWEPLGSGGLQMVG
jgi:hypothetical protein